MVSEWTKNSLELGAVPNTESITNDSYRRRFSYRTHVVIKIFDQRASVTVKESFERRSLESPRLSEALYRSIVATALDAILVIDDQAVIEKMNPAAERVFGYTGSEVVGSLVHTLIPEFSLEHDSSFQAVGRRKDGRMIPLEVSLSEVCVGSCRHFTLVGRDITE